MELGLAPAPKSRRAGLLTAGCAIVLLSAVAAWDGHESLALAYDDAVRIATDADAEPEQRRAAVAQIRRLAHQAVLDLCRITQYSGPEGVEAAAALEHITIAARRR